MEFEEFLFPLPNLLGRSRPRDWNDLLNIGSAKFSITKKKINILLLGEYDHGDGNLKLGKVA